jgi:hypothetical protein
MECAVGPAVGTNLPIFSGFGLKTGTADHPQPWAVGDRGHRPSGSQPCAADICYYATTCWPLARNETWGLRSSKRKKLGHVVHPASGFPGALD